MITMKNIFSLIGILAFFSFFFFTTSSHAYQEILIEERWWKPIRVIKVVLDGEDFVVASVAKEWGETLTQLMQKVWWTSAINGAFFCPKDYASCGGKTFSRYERVFMGEGESYSMFRPDTSIRGIFGFEQDGTPLFVQNKISTHDYGLNNNINQERIDDLWFGISNFPVILIEGKNVTAEAADYIDNKMTGKGNRNFICSTEDGKTVYMGVIGLSDIWDMAEYLKKYFWCYNALWLDAGASAWMIYDNKVLAKGSRSLITDAFVVVNREMFLEKLWGIPPKNPSKETPVYTLTSQDKRMVVLINQIVRDIISKKELTKSALISMIRKAVSSPTMTLQNKAIFNKVLINLFTIETLKPVSSGEVQNFYLWTI